LGMIDARTGEGSAYRAFIRRPVDAPHQASIARFVVSLWFTQAEAFATLAEWRNDSLLASDRAAFGNVGTRLCLRIKR